MQTGRRPRPIPLYQLYPLFFSILFLLHRPLLRLPYFWDEAGYYIPAAWDLFRTGSLIPITTLSNAHPPLPSLLLAAWWHISGFVPVGTRTLICLVAAAALLAVFRIARQQAGTTVATAVTVLTAAYPVWFVQSSLAHADIFAAAFTLWGLSCYLPLNQLIRVPQTATDGVSTELIVPVAAAIDPTARTWAAILFALAALSKETAIVTPLALAAWETFLYFLPAHSRDRAHLRWLPSLLFPVLPLAGWYAFHRVKTGYIFGNPEYLRYNATANLSAAHIALSLWHRLIHLTFHMNLYVPVLATCAVLLMPVRGKETRHPFRPALAAMLAVIAANSLAFSILGGALLTRYLLPLYPMILLLCVTEWFRRFRHWYLIAGLTLAGFVAALFINPPYTIAPEDNLSYRSMIVLHQRAANVLAQRFPAATVLTAWPATSELERPELGYVTRPIPTAHLEDFTGPQIEKAAGNPGAYDTALVFSTKCEPVNGLDLGKLEEASATSLFGMHHDLHPATIAALLHGEIVWQQSLGCEWAAVLHFPRTADARLLPPGEE